MRLPGEEVADARMARSSGLLNYAPWIAAYPLRGFALPVLLMITLFVTAGMRSDAFGTGLPLTGIPLLVITAIWSVHYLTLVIRDSARGHALPPALSAEVVFLSGGLRPLLLPVAVASLHHWLGSRHPPLAQALLLASVFLLPAYLFILATEESLAAALNPLRWLQTVLQLGVPYALSATALTVGVFSLGKVSGLFSLSVLAFLAVYLAVAAAHLLGYVGFARRGRLGLHVEVRHPDEVAREREQADRLAALLVRIESCLQHRDEAGAAREIAAEPGGPVSVRVFFEALFDRLLGRGNVHLVHAAGARLITVLLAENRNARALEVAERCLDRHPQFEPQAPEQIERLAREALQSRYDALFERLVRNLEQRYPAHPLQVNWQLLRAQFLAERRGDEAAALLLLRPLLALDTHPLQPRIAALTRALEHLQGGARARS